MSRQEKTAQFSSDSAMIREILFRAVVDVAHDAALEQEEALGNIPRAKQNAIRSELLNGLSMEDAMLETAARMIAWFMGTDKSQFGQPAVNDGAQDSAQYEARLAARTWVERNDSVVDILARLFAEIRSAYRAYEENPEPELLSAVTMYQALSGREDVRRVDAVIRGEHGSVQCDFDRRLLLSTLDQGACCTIYLLGRHREAVEHALGNPDPSSMYRFLFNPARHIVSLACDGELLWEKPRFAAEITVCA